ncbi:AEC family transporter [Deferribacter thermophilus]|uniref:AEC family transporter n=1 Tax=Deferribacter thermophilus TaxID=53573 RepID=UPI003C17285A
MTALFAIFIKTVLPIFIIIAFAYIYNKIKNIDFKYITDVTLTIFAPIFVFHSLMSHKIETHTLYKPFIFMIILISMLILIASITFKIHNFDDKYKIPFILSVSMINVGNFGLPLISFAYGEKGVLYSIIYFVVFNIPLSTLAIMLSSNEKNLLLAIKDVIKIPLIHAFILAIIFSELKITLPDFIEKPFSLMSNATIPLLIFILGLQLSKISISSKLLKPALLSVSLRLIASPIIAILIAKILNINGVEKQVAIVQTSAPSALLPLMYAIKFNKSPEFLSTTILLSTILSGITLPVLISCLT